MVKVGGKPKKGKEGGKVTKFKKCWMFYWTAWTPIWESISIGVNYGGQPGGVPPNVGIGGGGGGAPNNLGKKMIFFCNMQIFHAKPTVLNKWIHFALQILENFPGSWGFAPDPKTIIVVFISNVFFVSHTRMYCMLLCSCAFVSKECLIWSCQ